MIISQDKSQVIRRVHTCALTVTPISNTQVRLLSSGTYCNASAGKKRKKKWTISSKDRIFTRVERNRISRIIKCIIESFTITTSMMILILLSAL